MKCFSALPASVEIKRATISLEAFQSTAERSSVKIVGRNVDTELLVPSDKPPYPLRWLIAQT
jgi:hypothetical protein